MTQKEAVRSKTTAMRGKDEKMDKEDWDSNVQLLDQEHKKASAKFQGKSSSAKAGVAKIAMKAKKEAQLDLEILPMSKKEKDRAAYGLSISNTKRGLGDYLKKLNQAVVDIKVDNQKVKAAKDQVSTKVMTAYPAGVDICLNYLL